MARAEQVATPTNTSGPKAAIAKDKLSDDEFDKLVLDTSRRLAQQPQGSNLPELAGLEPSATTCADQPEPVRQNDTHQQSLGQPKRPMNAFMVWGQVIRRELHHRFSNVQNASLSKALGRVWRSLEANQKEPYVRRANLIKLIHKRDYPNYRYQPRRIQERRARPNMVLGLTNKLLVVEQQARGRNQTPSARCQQFEPPQLETPTIPTPDRNLVAIMSQPPRALQAGMSLYANQNAPYQQHQPFHLSRLHNTEQVHLAQHDTFSELPLIEQHGQTGSAEQQSLSLHEQSNPQQHFIHHHHQADQHQQHQHQHHHHQHHQQQQHYHPQLINDNNNNHIFDSQGNALQASQQHHLSSCSSSPELASCSRGSSLALDDTGRVAVPNSLEPPPLHLSSLSVSNQNAFAHHIQQQTYHDAQMQHNSAANGSSGYHQIVPANSVCSFLNLACSYQGADSMCLGGSLTSTYYEQQPVNEATVGPTGSVNYDHELPVVTHLADSQLVKRNSTVKQQHGEIFNNQFSNYVA